MPETKPIISIENVVASASVDQKLDLIDITKKFPDTEYHPELIFHPHCQDPLSGETTWRCVNRG